MEDLRTIDPRLASELALRHREIAEAKVRRMVAINIAEEMAILAARSTVAASRHRLLHSVSPLALAAHRSGHAR
jgi:cell division protein ZapA (FtsZ GTPase activity inhibitor)